MPWCYFVCIIQKYDFFVELFIPAVGIIAHKLRSTYWAALTAGKLGGKGTHGLSLHHWKRRTWQTKVCNPKMSTPLLTTEPAWTPAVFNWALCRCKCLPVTGSGLAGDSLTIHLPLCTSQLSCPENRNTNSVSMLRSLILCLPPPLHLRAEFHYLCSQQHSCRIWPAMVWVVRDIISSSTVWVE